MGRNLTYCWCAWLPLCLCLVMSTLQKDNRQSAKIFKYPVWNLNKTYLIFISIEKGSAFIYFSLLHCVSVNLCLLLTLTKMGKSCFPFRLFLFSLSGNLGQCHLRCQLWSSPSASIETSGNIASGGRGRKIKHWVFCRSGLRKCSLTQSFHAHWFLAQS